MNLEDLFDEQETDLLIFDGNNLAARCNYANSELRRKDGTKTGVVYGSIRSIKSLSEKFNPKKIVVVFDMGWSKRRLEIYPEYKQNRKDEHKTEEEIKGKQEYISQIKRLQEYLECLQINSIRIQKTEADDIIAYILQNINKEKTILVSTDSDFYQFIQFGIKIYHPIQNCFIDDDYMVNKIGVNSKNYLLFKSMLGDDTDDIPGIKGFGNGAALKIMKSQEIKKIEDLKESALKQKGKKFQAFVQNFNIVERNYKLIDLVNNYLDDNTIIEICNQLNKIKVFNPKILELSREDEINWDESFFNFCRK